MNHEIEIVEMNPADQEMVLDDLIVLLQDAVLSGASVGFLADLKREKAASYWRAQIQEAACGKRVILLARKQQRIVGSVQLALSSAQNGRHRAEVHRLIVLQSEGRQGIGTALMRRLESVALTLGRTLLVLNTRAGDPPETLYYRLGYSLVGLIPDYAQNPDGTFNTTSIMYRILKKSEE